MRIKAKKTGKFAHPIVSKPHTMLDRGNDYTVDNDLGKCLVLSGWADEVKTVVKDADPLADIVKNAESAEEAKDKLEQWGIDNLGVDVDKRKSIKKIIAYLTELKNG